MPSFTSSIIMAAVAVVATGAARQPKAETPARDPQAIAALDRMGKFLYQQRSFNVRTTTEHDYVLQSGQKAQIRSTGELRALRPDHLFAQVHSDRKDRRFYYDGKMFTMYAPKLGYYASVPAPPTIGQLADLLEDRYALELPMVDLFRFGTDASPIHEITGAIHVGAAMIDGVMTDQYAFRQPGVDWQIWIERGARPLPHKIVLTTTDDPARPEHSVEMSWQLNVRHSDSEFAFVPPKGTERIVIADLFAPSAPSAKAEARR
jgi:hypothetical protein